MAVQTGRSTGVEDALPVGPVGGVARNRRLAAERTTRERMRHSPRPRTGACRLQTEFPSRDELGVCAIAGDGRKRLAGTRLVVLLFRGCASLAVSVLVEHGGAGDPGVHR